MIGLEVRVEAALCELLLQVSVEFERILLSHQNADLLVIRIEVPQDALSHALKSAQDETIGYDHTLDKGLEATRDIEITELEPHISSCQVDWNETFLDLAEGIVRVRVAHIEVVFHVWLIVTIYIFYV